MPAPEPQLSEADAVKVAALAGRFHRTLARDAAVLATIVRALETPRGPARVDAESFAEFVRGIVRQELAR